KLYVPERTGGKVFVINTKTFKTEQVIQTRGENSSVEVRPSDVTIDHSENELYVSSQGVDGVNSGISVYDLSTGAFKKFVKFGTQALSMENDEGRDLVYVTDFGTGKIAIFDAKTDRVIGEVEMNGGKANDLTVTEDGSVIAVDKQDIANTTAAVPYVLNSKTGDGSMTDTYTSKATVDRNGKAVPSSQQKLVPNSIVKFHAEVSEGEFTSTATINPAKVPFQGYPKQATAVLIDPTLNFAEGTVDITRPYTFHVSGYDFEKPPAEGIRLFLVKEGEWSMGYDKLTDSELASIQKVSTIVPASAFVYNARTGKYSFDATLRVPANTMQYSQGYLLGTVIAGTDVATNRNYDSAVSLIVNDAKDAGNADNRDEADEPAFPTNASASPSASAAVAEKKPAVEQPKGEQSKAEDANDQLGTTAKTAPLKNSSSVKSESQPKGSSSDAQVNASATKSAPQSKGSLAKTGAQNVLSLSAVGAFALIAGAAVMVLRRRKA
ncbi:MAG: LPXTG cell wall anchor domain-containing protein, partial [Rothia mucilaginosa]|uniref:LPXTG cell wall anchor domain-containing protein n=1 Tax=Rothia mucilaginosa TaxID=43675 RepID=UPI0026F18BCA